MQITLGTKLWKHIHTIFKWILRNWKVGQLRMFLLVFPSLLMFWPGCFYYKWQVNISYIYTHYNLCLQTINILTVISTLWIIEWIEYHIMSNELIQSRVWYVKTKDRRGIAQHRHLFIYHHIFLTKNGNSLVPYHSVAVTTFPIKASVVTMYDLQ